MSAEWVQHPETMTVHAPDWSCQKGGCRLVAVIPVEDREAVERLVEVMVRFEGPGPATFADRVQLALREFADPKPPKPEEPMGLGAVVEDADGRIYTRYETDREPQPWWQSKYGPEADVVRRFSWSDIDAVKVLREGVR